MSKSTSDATTDYNEAISPKTPEEHQAYIQKLRQESEAIEAKMDLTYKRMRMKRLDPDDPELDHVAKQARLYEAMAKAQLELEGAAKTGSNPAFRSKYAKLDGVWDAWQEVGPKNGLAVLMCVEDAGFVENKDGTSSPRQGIHLRTILTHKDGGRIESVSYWPSVKNDPQGYGSALTYARRYALMALTGICPIDDDDGNAASGKDSGKSEQTKHRDAITEKFTEAFQKYHDDKAKLATILAEANKAGLTDIAKKIHARIQELA